MRIMNILQEFQSGLVGYVLGQQLRQTFVPAPKRHRRPMPVIPLRNDRLVRRGVGVRDRLQQHIDDARSIEINWVVVVNSILGFMLLATALGVVHFSYENRQQVTVLSELRSDRDQLQQEWAYLMRDQNELSAFSRIEASAIDSLNMHRPEKNDIYIIGKVAGVVESGT